jgi:general secretion pathway protein I
MTRSALRRAGFTLLEVMIAVVILAIGLSSLFTSEAGAIRIAQRARTTTVATLLARCKMAEVEEKVLKEGFPGDIIEGNDECCTDGEHDGYECEWKVERIKLPDMQKEGDEEEDDKGEKKEGDKKSGGEGKDKASGGSSMLDQLSELSKDGPGERMNAITDVLSGGKASKDSESSTYGFGDAGPGSGIDNYSEGDMDPISSMVMGMAFPIMKPVIEEGVRRATVKVKWKEGDKEREFEVVQFLVSEQQLILPEGEDVGDGGAPGAPAGSTPGGASPAGSTPGGANPNPGTPTR